MCQCIRVFFLITASCHILAITVSTVNVLIYCPLAASPRVALVGIFCCATLYVSVCVCEGECRISGMVLVLVLIMCCSLKHMDAAATMCFLVASVVRSCMLGHVGLVAMHVHLPSRWPLLVSFANRITLYSDMSFAGAEHFLSTSRLSVVH